MQKSSPFRFVAGGMFAVLAVMAIFSGFYEAFENSSSTQEALGIVFGIISFNAFVLITLGMFLKKPGLAIAGSAIMMAVSIVMIIFNIVGVAEGGIGYSRYRYSSYYYYGYYDWYYYYTETYFILTMICTILTLVAWVFSMISSIARRAAIPMAIVSAALLFIATIFLFVANGEKSASEIFGYNGQQIVRTFYYILLMPATIFGGIAMSKIPKNDPSYTYYNTPAPNSDYNDNWNN